MNIFKKILIVLLCSIFFTCTNNTENLITDESLNINDNLTVDVKSKLSLPDFNNNQFENDLQWISYIAAKAIMTNPEARLEVYNKLNGRKRISLTELISFNTSNLSPFKTTFISILTQEINIDLFQPGRDPVHGSQTPPRPITTKSEKQESPTSKTKVRVNTSANILANTFLIDVVFSRCIELYFPKNLKPTIAFDDQKIIVSTAHPLNSDQFNNGYLQSSIDQFNINNISTSPIQVAPGFLSSPTFNDLIVARPYKSINSLPSNCLYNEYPIDFSLFLKL